MALTLMRHAPLHPKYQGRYNGWTDLAIEPTLFNPLRIDTLTQHPFDMVLSSDLQRCTQTLEMMGIKTYRTDPRLREVRFKAHIEGKSFDEISKMPHYDEQYLKDATAWHRYICAESPEAFERRIRSFLAELPTDKEILICSHAGSLQKILSMLGLHKAKIGYLETIRVELHGVR